MSSVKGFRHYDEKGNLIGIVKYDYHSLDNLPQYGFAELDKSGKILSSQLPSYVDDVKEGYYIDGAFYADKNNLNTWLEQQPGKIYIDKDTNLTYRWSGSMYVKIASDLALGETSATAYRGDRGKIAYDHAQLKGNAYASNLYKFTTNEAGHITNATAVTKEDITKLGIPGKDTTYGAGGAVLGLVKNGGNVTINPDGTMTAPECAVNDVKYKYFNFIEPGVNVAGNPTYDEIKEAILSDVTPILIDGHYIASMTSGHWDAEAFEREKLPGFTFVTHRSDMNNHWKIKYTEFWCTKQDDGSTLWVVGEHYYIEDFVAEYGVTTFSEIQDAYNHEKIIFCKDSWLVAKLDLFAPDYYAQFSGLDNLGNPVLLKVTKDNVWTNTYAEKATPDYVDSEINKVNATIANQKTFVAEYGTTTYEELLNAYADKRQLVLRIPDNTLDGVSEMYANLMSNNGSSFNFICLDWSNIKYRFYAYRNNNDTIWEHDESTLAEYAYAKIIDDNFKNFVNKTNNTLDNYNMNINSLFKLVYGFRGGMCDNAGTLDIKAPGIYLVLQGGSGNKTLTIAQDGAVVYKSPECNGWIVLSSDTGVVTPIGIKSGMAALAGSFETPGTYVGWGEGVTTKITYPANCVIWHLGNSNNE